MRTTHRHRPATPAEVTRALEHVEQLYRRTPLEIARDHMATAKAEYTSATEALMHQAPGAAERADAALAALNAALQHLARLDAQEAADAQ